jgi:hypothetical protein
MKEISFEAVHELMPNLFNREFSRQSRTREDVYREYNDDKYSVLRDAVSFEDALARYRGPVRDIVISRHGKFYVVLTDEAYAMREKLIIEALAPLVSGIDTVIELGAGFGQTLEKIRRAYPAKRYIAGEFSAEARTLGACVLPHIEFKAFDFYDETWPLFETVGGSTLVLSFHAIEMVPDATVVAEKLRRYGVTALSLFEPAYESGDDPVLVERRGYIERHEYCRNILQAFQPDEVERDFFGINPLFPEANLTITHAL